jgi:hypothetical protein
MPPESVARQRALDVRGGILDDYVKLGTEL